MSDSQADDTKPLTDAARRRARIRLMSALSKALHRAEYDGLDPYGEVQEILGYARHGLDHLDSYLDIARDSRAGR